MGTEQSRRNALKTIITGSAILGLSSALPTYASEMEPVNAPLKGNVNHSVCRWCFSGIPLDELCAAVKGMGLKAMDLAGPADWPTLKKTWIIFIYV